MSSIARQTARLSSAKLYRALHAALESAELSAVQSAIALIPRKAPPDMLGRLLLETVYMASSPIALKAAHLLRRMPDGAGASFLLEALNRPDAPAAARIVERVELGFVPGKPPQTDEEDASSLPTSGFGDDEETPSDEDDVLERPSYLETGSPDTLHVDQLFKGDLVRVEAGEVVPCDGVLESGEGVFDEGMLRRIHPKNEKLRGARVFRGTQLVEGSVVLRHENHTAPLLRLIELRELGPSWVRLKWILGRMPRSSRVLLLERLLEEREVVPFRHWKKIVLACGTPDLVGLLYSFQNTLRRSCQDHRLERIERRTFAAIATALLERLNAERDPEDVRSQLLELLVEVCDTHHFIERAVHNRLEHTTFLELQRRFVEKAGNPNAEAYFDPRVYLRREHYKQLKEALETGGPDTLSAALDALPPAPSEDLGRLLQAVIETRHPELALRAGLLLVGIPRGAGMPFLIEAIATPGLGEVTDELIALLNFSQLGTGWLRLERTLSSLEPRHRHVLLDRLLERRHLVPNRRWSTIVSACQDDEDLHKLLHCFEAMCRHCRGLHNPRQERSIMRAVAQALLARLESEDDIIKDQDGMVELLAEGIEQHGFIASRLLSILNHTESDSLRLRILIELHRKADAISEQLIVEAVPELVRVVCERGGVYASHAIGALHVIARLGEPTDWEPLVSATAPGAHALALRSYELQEADVSRALYDLLLDPVTSTRLAAAEIIGRRFAHDRSIRLEPFEALILRIIHDPEAEVALGLDIHSIFHFAPPEHAYTLTRHTLYTEHASLLERLFFALSDPALCDHVLEGGDLLRLTDAVLHALSQLEDTIGTQHALERLAGFSRLLLLLPPSRVYERLSWTLHTLSPRLRLALISSLGELDIPEWQELRTLAIDTMSATPQPASLESLKEHPSPEAFWAALSALSHTDPTLRFAAVEALGALAHPASAPFLITMLDDPEESVRGVAAHALTQLRSLRGYPPLAKHPDFPEAERKLHKIVKPLLEATPLEWPYPEPLPSHPPRLFFSLTTEDAWLVQVRSTRLLGRLFGRRYNRPVDSQGRIALAHHSWWQHDRLRDTVLVWDRPFTFRLTRAPETRALLGRIPVTFEFRQERHIEHVLVGLRLLVALEPAIQDLPITTPDAAALPFLVPGQQQRFLSHLRAILEARGVDLILDVPEA